MTRTVFLAACVLLAACGGAKGFQAGTSLPTRYRSIAVPMFQNATYDRQVGYLLTEAIQKRLQQVSPYAITGEGTADTVLRGKVKEVQVRQLSQSLGTGLSEEVGYTVTIDWEWVDMRTGKPIVALNDFAASGMVVASRPQAEPLDLAKYSAVEQLAMDVVANMQADW